MLKLDNFEQHAFDVEGHPVLDVVGGDGGHEDLPDPSP
jgi:dihydroxyacetone kinase